MKIAILTSVFSKEFGVARVIASQLPYLVQAGFSVDVYACELDSSLLCQGAHGIRIPTHLRGLSKVLQAGHYDVLIAHTDPFYKLIAENDFGAVTIGYDHGYPPLDLCMPEEREWRAADIGNRVEKVYPALSCVVTISQYAVNYLNWRNAKVIYNGADHYDDFQANSNPSDSAAVSILAVSRYRMEEWNYKGMDSLCRLKNDFGEKVNITLVGRGDKESTQKLRGAGVNVVGMVSEKDLAELYKKCDALVSFSRWELFNLPLGEAGFAHKPAIALNLCAHPEVTPFVFDSYEGIRDYLACATRESLKADGEKMFRFVDGRFRWKSNGEKLATLLHQLCPNPRNRDSSLRVKFYWIFWKIRESIRQNVYKRIKALL